MRLAAGPEWSGEIWQSALAALERKYSKPVFEMWLKPMRLVDHLYFVAEHDDHHLARIWELVNAVRQSE